MSPNVFSEQASQGAVGSQMCFSERGRSAQLTSAVWLGILTDLCGLSPNLAHCCSLPKRRNQDSGARIHDAGTGIYDSGAGITDFGAGISIFVFCT